MARDFKAALQQRDALQNIDQTVPGFLPDPSTYMQPTPGGKRRARTFSQTIADATRGIEAGSAPSGGKMDSMGSEPGVNMARPDWRGHYDAAQRTPAPRASLQLATVKRATPSTLYSHRPLLNAAELHAWATAAGIPNLVPPHEMHVTTIYSRQAVDIAPRTDTVIAKRNIAPLGDKGAMVLHFESPELQAQHAQARAAGAGHDFPSFLTHVTLSYDTGGKDFSGLEAPKFPLVFGPEVHKPINENWAEEKGLRKGFDPSEARDNDGKWTDGGGGFGSTSPEKFIQARSASDRAAFLSGHTASELADHRLFVSQDHKVGYALDKDGDLQNLFNNGGPKGAGQKALVDAIKHGATTLDAFDPGLPRLYSKYGFVPVARIPFNEDYAPAGWNYQRDGKPDVVFMAYRGGDRDSIEQRIGTFPEYQPGSAPLVSDYDAGKAAQRSASVGKGAESGGPAVLGQSHRPLWRDRFHQSLEKHSAGIGIRRQFLGGAAKA